MAINSSSLEEFTVPEKILLAANDLEEKGQTPFSAEALIVAAWGKYPNTFGLKGFAQLHPDSNKILASIMGEKGLVRRGWLSKVGQKMYTLTREGLLVVKRIQKGEDRPAPRHHSVRLSRDTDRTLLVLLETVALEKFQEGRKLEINFADACKFWSISDNRTDEEVDTRIAQVRKTLTNSLPQVGKGNAVLSNGRSISGGDIGALVETHNFMEERFNRHLNLLRSRSARA